MTRLKKPAQYRMRGLRVSSFMPHEMDFIIALEVCTRSKKVPSVNFWPISKHSSQNLYCSRLVPSRCCICICRSTSAIRLLECSREDFASSIKPTNDVSKPMAIQRHVLRFFQTEASTPSQTAIVKCSPAIHPKVMTDMVRPLMVDLI